jgi:hypothetical protein
LQLPQVKKLFYGAPEISGLTTTRPAGDYSILSQEGLLNHALE